MPYFALQPVLNDWQAALLLQSLKDKHPALAGRSWDEIASDPEAVAKLYSGYMGAGGDWAGWLADDAPGPVARQRLGLGAMSAPSSLRRSGDVDVDVADSA